MSDQDLAFEAMNKGNLRKATLFDAPTTNLSYIKPALMLPEEIGRLCSGMMVLRRALRTGQITWRKHRASTTVEQKTWVKISVCFSGMHQMESFKHLL